MDPRSRSAKILQLALRGSTSYSVQFPRAPMDEDIESITSTLEEDNSDVVLKTQDNGSSSVHGGSKNYYSFESPLPPMVEEVKNYIENVKRAVEEETSEDETENDARETHTKWKADNESSVNAVSCNSHAIKVPAVFEGCAKDSVSEDVPVFTYLQPADPFEHSVAEVNQSLQADFSSDDSVADPTFVLPSNEGLDRHFISTSVPSVGESGTLPGPEGQQLEKKRKVNVRKQEKEKRDKGLESVTRKGKIVPARQFLALDNCCTKKCCEKISEDSQKMLFESFYKCSKAEQKQILASGIIISKKQSERKTRGKKGGQHYDRQISAQYMVKLEDKVEKVCKTMYSSLYGQSKYQLDYLLEKMKKIPLPLTSLEDQRGRHEPGNKKLEQRAAMLKHLEKYPKYESHYSRRDSKKLYLQSHLNRKIIYEEFMKESTGDDVGSYDMFREVFKSTGYSFKKPHVDTCKTCDTYTLKIKTANANEKGSLIKKHDEHKEKADLGYKMKSQDKEMAKKDSSIRVLVFDLQQVLDTPSLTANVSFYKRLLSTYNLTIRDCTAEETSCFMWHESIGKRGSEEIASCVMRKLESLPNEVCHIITYSDTCGGQNRNINMACMFSYFASRMPNISVIDQKFLLPGHTHLECDVDHARIERAKKHANIPIMAPRDWYQFVRTVRGKKNFQVKEMTQDDFFSYSAIVRENLVRRTTDINGRKINWLEIKWLRYEKTFGIISFKINLDDVDFRTMDLRRTKRGQHVPLPEILTKCYDGPLPINPLKKQDLLSLRPLISEEYHNFYENLPTDKKVPALPHEESSDDE